MHIRHSIFFSLILLFFINPDVGFSKAKKTPSKAAKDPNAVQIHDIQVGQGKVAESGHRVKVHYDGHLNNANGTKFDSSRDRNTPFEFDLGKGQVIRGWDEGVVGMKVGGIRELTIPPAKGYGAQKVGTIPPNSTLYFKVELLDVN